MSNTISINRTVNPEAFLKKLDKLQQESKRSDVNLRFSSPINETSTSKKLKLVSVGCGEAGVTLHQCSNGLMSLIDRIAIDDTGKTYLKEKIGELRNEELTVCQLRRMLTDAMAKNDPGYWPLRSDSTVKLDLLTSSFRFSLKTLEAKPSVYGALLKQLSRLHEEPRSNSIEHIETLQDVLDVLLATRGAFTDSSDDALLQIIEPSFYENKGLVNAFRDAIASADYPGAVIRAAAIFAQKGDALKRFQEDGAFRSKSTYVRNVLKMVGKVGHDAPERLEAFIENSRLKENLFSIPNPGEARDARFKRTNHVSDALIASADRLSVPAIDLDFEAAKNALDDVMFSPAAGLSDPSMPAGPSYALAVQMRATLAYFQNEKSAQRNILEVTGPSNPAARILVAGSVGVSHDRITDRDTQRAVVNAMLSNVRQGAVGTCSTTAPLIKLRAHNPDRMLRMYTEIATRGCFTDAQKIQTPAVTKVTADGDPLLRSLEATIMTAAIRNEASGIQKAGKRAASAASKMLRPSKMVGFLKRLKNTPKEQVAIATALQSIFEYIYFPDRELVYGTDGVSTHGVYVLAIKGENPPELIETKEDWIDATIRALTADRTINSLKKEFQNEDILRHIVGESKFLELFKNDGRYPWEVKRGQNLVTIFSTLYGGRPKISRVAGKFKGEKDGNGEKRSARATDIVASLLAAPPSSKGQNSVVGVPGHGVTFLSDHPSLRIVKGSTKAELNTSIQSALLGGLSKRLTSQQGEEVADALDAAFNGAYLDTKLMALDRDFCRSGVTLQDFLDYVKGRLRSYAEELGKIETNNMASRGIGEPRWEQLDKSIKDKIIDDNIGYFESVLKTISFKLIQKFSKVKEIVFIDTNWGDDKVRNAWALCVNPGTLKIDLYQIDNPKSQNKPVDSDFLEGEWKLYYRKEKAR
ncbi:hypothetical protein [Roseibium aggregatum]|nr:hypothetical protein [Roseibium aggregatum]